MEQETLHGMRWDDMLALRNTFAGYWHRRHGRRVPLEEYLSAGNLAIAEAASRFNPARGVPWTSYLHIALHHTLRKVRIREAGAGNLPERRTSTGRQRAEKPEYAIRVQPPEWPGWKAIPTAPRQENYTFLHEVCTFLAQHVSEDKLGVFEQSVWGQEFAVIAAALDVTQRAITTIMTEVRCLLYTWTNSRPPGATTYSREFVAEVQRRKAAGETYITIQRALKCAPNAIRIALTQPPVAQEEVAQTSATSKTASGAQCGGALGAVSPTKVSRTPILDHAGGGTVERRTHGTSGVAAVAQRKTAPVHHKRSKRQQILLRYSLDPHPEDHRQDRAG